MFGNRYRSAFCRPLAPMCRPHVNPCLDSGFDPPAKNAAAGKSNRMHAARVDNRQFQIAIEWRSRYWVPHGPPHKAGRPMWVVPRYKRISSGLIFGNCRRHRSPARRPRLAAIFRQKLLTRAAVRQELAPGMVLFINCDTLLEALHARSHVWIQPHRVGIALASQNPKCNVRP